MSFLSYTRQVRKKKDKVQQSYKTQLSVLNFNTHDCLKLLKATVENILIIHNYLSDSVLRSKYTHIFRHSCFVMGVMNDGGNEVSKLHDIHAV